MVRTVVFHTANRGSIPLGATMIIYKIISMISLSDLIASGSLIVSVVAIYWTYKLNLRLSNRTLTYEESGKILKSLFDLESYLDELIVKHKIDIASLPSSMSNEEKLKINLLITAVNLSLAKLFTIIPDGQYRIINENWPTNTSQLRDLRERVNILLRQSQYAKTRFNKKENIKLIHKK